MPPKEAPRKVGGRRTSAPSRPKQSRLSAPAAESTQREAESVHDVQTLLDDSIRTLYNTLVEAGIINPGNESDLTGALLTAWPGLTYARPEEKERIVRANLLQQQDPGSETMQMMNWAKQNVGTLYRTYIESHFKHFLGHFDTGKSKTSDYTDTYGARKKALNEIKKAYSARAKGSRRAL